MCSSVRTTIRRLFGQVTNLVREIPLRQEDVDAVRDADKSTLASTAMVWGTCDLLVGLGETGLVGIVVRQALEYRDLLKDAIDELKEWIEGTEGAEDPFDESDSGEDDFGSLNIISKENPILRAQVEGIVKKLQHVDLIYPPIIKRRLRRFPPVVSAGENKQRKANLAVLDEVVGTLKLIPEEVDELAAACYQGDEDEIKSQVARVCELATKAMERLNLNWQGETDEFTAWSGKWLQAMESS